MLKLASWLHVQTFDGKRRQGAMLLVALAVIYLLPLLVQPGVLIYPASNLGSDLALSHWPEFAVFVRYLREGTVPLLDGSILLGRPLAGDVGTLWMYPPVLLFLVIAPAPAFNLLSLAHIAAAGLFAYFYFRRSVKLTESGAWIGALAFMFWPKFITHVTGGHIGLGGAAALLPLTLWGAHKAFAEGKWYGAVLIAISLYGQLTGLVQNFIYAVWIVVGYALAALVWRARRRPVSAWSLAQPLAALGLSGALTGGLAAAVLLPALELLPIVTRQGLSLEAAGAYSLPPVLLLNLLLPLRQQFPEWMMYIGAVPLMLCVFALNGSRRMLAWVMVGLAALVAVYSLGPQGVLFTLAYEYLPGFDLLRAAPRLWLAAGVPIAILVGLGFEALVSRPRLRRPQVIALIVISASLFTAALSTFVTNLIDPLIAVADLLALAAFTGLLTLHRRGRVSAAVLRHGVMGVLITTSLITSWRFLSFIRPEETFLREFPVFDIATAAYGSERWYAETPRFPYALAGARGIETVQAIQSFQLVYPVELITLASGCTLHAYTSAVPACLTSEVASGAPRVTQPSARLLGMLNARWMLRAQPPADGEWRPVPGQANLYENLRFLPRAFVVGEARRVAPESVLAQLREIDPATSALVVDELPAALTRPEASGPVASFEYRSPQSLVIEVKRDAPGLLVVSMAWAPGWRATVDGAPAEVYRTNHALLGVYLPAGEHTITLDYSPLGWRWGWPISLVTLLAICASVVARLVVQRRSKINRPSLP
jgi:hypothetical protein